MTNKLDSIVSTGLWVVSIAVGFVAAETTYNTGKKIIEYVYNDVILEKINK